MLPSGSHAAASGALVSCCVLEEVSAGGVSVLLELPQAAKLSTIRHARTSARILLIFFIPFLLFITPLIIKGSKPIFCFR